MDKWLNNVLHPSATVLVKRLEVARNRIARNLLNISRIWSRDWMHFLDFLRALPQIINGHPLTSNVFTQTVGWVIVNRFKPL